MTDLSGQPVAHHPMWVTSPAASSHVHHIHLGTSILCPYCPDKRSYNADNWCKHMHSEHRDAPWFVTPPQTPAIASPAAITTAGTTNKLPPFTSFSVPLPPPALAVSHQEEPVADTLPCMPEEEDSAVPESTSAS